MAEIVLRLEETLPDITHPVVGGPSISVGTIHGGEKVNVVPAQCVAEIDRRAGSRAAGHGSGRRAPPRSPSGLPRAAFGLGFSKPTVAERATVEAMEE
jgi:hypothetical protein